MFNKNALLQMWIALALAASACGDDDGPPPVIDAATADVAVTPPDGGDLPDAPPGMVDATPAMIDATPGTVDAMPLPDAMPEDIDIRLIQDGTIATGTAVRIADVIVTARGDGASSTVLFIQEPAGAPEFSGLFVFIDTTPLPPFAIPAVGDLVTIEGTVDEFVRSGFSGSRTNLDPVTDITITSSGNPLPAPVVVPEADLVALEQWEGVVVRVEPATVATRDMFGEFTLTGGLKADDRLFAYTQPFPGDEFAFLAGPLDFDFGTARILPRGASDFGALTPAPPILTGLTPAMTSVGVGSAVTYTVTIDRAAPAGGTTIDVDAVDPLVAAPAAPTVTVAAGATTATFDVTGFAAGDTQITATLGGTTLTADLSVIAAGDPVIVSMLPSTLEILAMDGTGILTILLDRDAPAGGTTIALSSSMAAEIEVPMSVTVPAGSSYATFRVHSVGPTAASATITATLDGVDTTATVTSVVAATPPAVGDVVLNEINADVTSAAGSDANCDGSVSTTFDEFIEVVNVSAHPVEMLGVSLWDNTAFTGAAGIPNYSFPSFVLGPGEAVVVFGGVLGTTGTAPWCTNLDGAHIGDARAFAGAAFQLNNSGTPADTVRITATPSNTSAELQPAVAVPDTTNQSYTRSPDITGGFVFDADATGQATDRPFSPGTRVTARPFSDASP